MQNAEVAFPSSKRSKELLIPLHAARHVRLKMSHRECRGRSDTTPILPRRCQRSLVRLIQRRMRHFILHSDRCTSDRMHDGRRTTTASGFLFPVLVVVPHEPAPLLPLVAHGPLVATPLLPLHLLENDVATFVVRLSTRPTRSRSETFPCVLRHARRVVRGHRSQWVDCRIRFARYPGVAGGRLDASLMRCCCSARTFVVRNVARTFVVRDVARVLRVGRSCSHGWHRLQKLV